LKIGDKIHSVNGGGRIRRKWPFDSEESVVYTVTGFNTVTGAAYAQQDTERFIRDLTIPAAKLGEWAVIVNDASTISQKKREGGAL
jgi:hypothetical protein